VVGIDQEADMRRNTRSTRLAIALIGVVLMAAACSSSGDANDEATPAQETEQTSTTAPSTTAAAPEGSGSVDGLTIVAVDFADGGSVVLENRGSEALDVSGAFICQFPTYVDLGTLVDGASIEPGASVTIAGSDIGGLAVDGGEVALYSNDADFGAADGIVAFVQWGVGGARGDVAAQAGLWPAADVTVIVDPAINGIELFGDPADPENWG
jgi:hypothetical protein